ncbi:MAG: GNAT family N-acetyltransferase [Sphingomonas sp.]|nr:GNAT family N-acetyltransferase [Sphingomonas sp.]
MSTTLNIVELCSGTTSDLPVIDTIMQRAFDPRFGEAWTRGQCLGIMAMPGVFLTIARVNGQAVGFAMARTVMDEVELLLLATMPDARRRGVGRALVNAVISTGREHGAIRVHLEVRAGNDAIKLYQDAGFAKIGERRGYYRGATGQLFDALTFSRAIK